MRTATLNANGIDIAYDAFGDEDDRPLVLVMGLGAQRLAWADEVCDDLAAAGRYVVRFDNRDVGDSTHFAELGPPTVFDVLRGRPPYRLEDMAEDLIGLLDALSIEAADVQQRSGRQHACRARAQDSRERARSADEIVGACGASRRSAIGARRRRAGSTAERVTS